jgi:hypothetical protein
VKELNEEEFRNIVVEHMTLQWLKQNGLDPADPKTPAIEIDEDEETSQLYAWKLTAEEAFDYFLEALDKIESMGYGISSETLDDATDSEGADSDLLRDYLNDNFGSSAKSPPAPPEPKLINTPSIHKVQKSRLTKTNATFLFLDTPAGEPTYVSDVREWLAEVDSLNIPDDTEVEGTLHLSYDTDILTSERSECLYCGDKQDILLTVHDCMAGEEDV